MNHSSGNVTGRMYLGLFVVTLSTLMYEILLTRIFSVTMSYHFAFMAISIAMFGMTVGALIVYLAPRYFAAQRAKSHLTLSTLLFAIMFSAACGCGMNKPSGKFKLTSRRITIHTQPEGAEVTQLRPLGQPSSSLGKTPINDLSVSVMTNFTMKNMPFSQAQELIRHGGNVVVLIKRDGYETYSGTLKTDPNETVVHNIELQPKDS